MGRIKSTDLHQLYLDHRRTLDVQSAEEIASFSKIVTTFSTAGLGFSLAFAKQFEIDGGLSGSMMAGSWIAFAAAITFNLASHLLSHWAHESDRDSLDKAYENGTPLSEANRSRLGTFVSSLNILAALLFFVGIVGLIGSAWIKP